LLLSLANFRNASNAILSSSPIVIHRPIDHGPLVQDLWSKKRRSSENRRFSGPDEELAIGVKTLRNQGIALPNVIRLAFDEWL
jgi:hypothetical protein